MQVHNRLVGAFSGYFEFWNAPRKDGFGTRCAPRIGVAFGVILELKIIISDVDFSMFVGHTFLES